MSTAKKIFIPLYFWQAGCLFVPGFCRYDPGKQLV
jgi:hypothetical protein